MDAELRSSSRTRFMLAGFFLVLVGFVGFTLWVHRQLPDRVPVHFDGAGFPNRYSSKVELLVVNLGVAGLMLVIFGILPFFIGRIPKKLLNFPHKEYWLAPERARKSIDDLNFYYVAMGIATIALMWFILWGTYEVGAERREALPFSWWALGSYFALLGWFCVAVFRRFPKPPRT